MYREFIKSLIPVVFYHIKVRASKRTKPDPETSFPANTCCADLYVVLSKPLGSALGASHSSVNTLSKLLLSEYASYHSRYRVPTRTLVITIALRDLGSTSRTLSFNEVHRQSPIPIIPAKGELFSSRSRSTASGKSDEGSLTQCHARDAELSLPSDLIHSHSLSLHLASSSLSFFVSFQTPKIRSFLSWSETV